MNETQQKIQAEVERQMGRMMMDLIAGGVERQALASRVSELEAEKDAADDA